MWRNNAPYSTFQHHNASNQKISYAELVLANTFVIAAIWILERVWLLKHQSSKRIIYEKIELIKPENRNDLREDLEKRTGLEIVRIEIGKVNFLNDTAEINIYYYNNYDFEDGEYDAQTFVNVGVTTFKFYIQRQ